jgi:hypothetical protein
MNNTEKITYWVNRFGEKIPISEMETLYLYNTVKMIFNNCLMRLHPFGDVIQWNFNGPIHTPDFLSEFFRAGMAELKVRKDNEMAHDFIVHAEKHLDVRPETAFKEFSDQ